MQQQGNVRGLQEMIDVVIFIQLEQNKGIKFLMDSVNMVAKRTAIVLEISQKNLELNQSCQEIH